MTELANISRRGGTSLLRTERVRQELSLRELAYFVRCSHVAIQRMENGTLQGSAELKARIARTLRVPISDLWPESELAEASGASP